MFAAGKTDGAVSAVVNYIEDVFSTYLYTGNGSTQTITNGIDLSTKGGLVWTKARTTTSAFSFAHALIDTVRGAGIQIVSNGTSGNATQADSLTAFNSNGYTLGADTGQGRVNNTSYGTQTYVSWTFREQAKFFDVVTYTGTGSLRTVSHNLGSTPGCILIKNLSDSDRWAVYHQSLGATQTLCLNETTAAVTDGNTNFNNTAPTSTEFTVNTTARTNQAGNNYVAYLFAHNAGGFGLTGTDNVISCGSYTTDGSGNATINLGYEPQWLMVKASSGTYGVSDWRVVDVMRGMSQTNIAVLYPNYNGPEDVAGRVLVPTATGFLDVTGFSNTTFIYIAIRRGPMKVPTSGTSVYESTAYTGNGASNRLIGSSVLTDLLLLSNRDATSTSWSTYGQLVYDRLRGQGVSLATSNTNAEVSGWTTYFNLDMNTGWDTGGTTDQAYLNKSSSTYVSNAFRRAPSFMDVVCWTSNDTYPQVLNHNLTVAPELIIRKPRSISDEWAVGFNFQTSSYKKMALNTTAAQTSYGSYSSGPFPGKPTATQFTDQGSASGRTFVAYLFATCAGVSKVGSYTGNGSTQTINCGFTGGARFVLIKRTDATGDWYVYDTARGMTVLTDPYLQLNSTAAETATLGSVTTVSTGFALDSTILAAINVSSGTYIFLAIA